MLSRVHSPALRGLGLTAGQLPHSCLGVQLRAALEIFPFLETFAVLEEKNPITPPSALSSHQCSPGSAAGKEEPSPATIPPWRGEWRGKPGPLSSCMFQPLLAGNKMGTNIFIHTTCQTSDLMGTASQRPPLWICTDPKALHNCCHDPAASSLDPFPRSFPSPGGIMGTVAADRSGSSRLEEEKARKALKVSSPLPIPTTCLGSAPGLLSHPLGKLPPLTQ